LTTLRCRGTLLCRVFDGVEPMGRKGMKVITETMKIQGAEHVEYRRPGGLLPSTRTLRLVRARIA